MEDKETVVFHPVEGAADVKAAVVEFGSYLLHEDVERLGAGRVEASREEETGDALPQTVWGGSPGVVAQALGLGGQQVEHVEAEHQLGFQQEEDLLFVDADNVAGCLSLESGRVALADAEEAFRLYDVWCADGFADSTAMVVADGFCPECAAGEEMQVCTGVVLPDQPLADSQF